MDFLNELNAPQKAAAENVDGPMMVIAGAGSGKTRVLTYRIANLMNKGVDPFSILALTFTNKAAREMKERIGRIVGESEARNLWMGTFHSIFARILRIECDRLNYPSNFTIYDTQDTKNLLKDIIKRLNLDDKVYKVSSVAARISGAKNNLINAEAYAMHSEIQAEDKLSGKPLISQIFKAYESRCFRAGAMDFDDLLYKMNVLLRDNPDILLKYQHRFQYIMVDEYQDTNYAQYLIIKQLSAAHENICVVGDDAQSIYGFRGASIQNILSFKNDYPDAKTFKLEQNYRSTKAIVQAANSVIAVNKDQIKKEVWTDNSKGDLIKVHRASSDNNEGRFVADKIFEVRNKQACEYKDFAILYRTNAQSRSFEESLRKLNIPYRIFGGQSFYTRKEIKDLIAYFRLTVNNKDDEALRRIINYPARGIGATTLDRLFLAANESGTGVFDYIMRGEKPASMNNGSWKKVVDFAVMIQSFESEIPTKSAHSLALHIAKRSGIVHHLYTEKQKEGNYNEGTERYENVQELLSGIHAFSEENEDDKLLTLRDYLAENIELLTDADDEQEDDNKVGMMTIHSAKGLEFKHVFVVGMEEDLFPSQRSKDSRADMEEERRLFYVALTRACETCTLSYATMRFKWGQLHQGVPSRFLDEIDEQYIIHPSVAPQRGMAGAGAGSFKPGGWGSGVGSAKITGAGSAGRPKILKNTEPSGTFGRKLRKLPSDTPTQAASPAANSAASQAASGGKLQEGVHVAHAKFGKGKVVKLEGTAPNTKATIQFDNSGIKQLLLKFAKLEILGVLAMIMLLTGCCREDCANTYILEGTLVSSIQSEPCEGFEIVLEEQVLEGGVLNGFFEEAATTSTDAAGYFRMEFPRKSALAYRVKVEEDGWFNLNEDINPESFVPDVPLILDLVTTPVSELQITVTNMPPSTEDDVARLRLLKSFTAYSNCHTEWVVLNGEGIDSTWNCVLPGGTWMPYLFIDQTDPEDEISTTDSVFCEPFSSAQIHLEY